MLAIECRLKCALIGNSSNSPISSNDLFPPMVEIKHSMKLASMNYFQLRRTSILIQWPTSLHLRICPMYLESKSKWIAQRSAQLNWSTNTKFTSSRSAKTDYTIMTLWIKIIYLMQLINLMLQLILIRF